MRILHVITTLSRGGAENHLVQLAARQKASGDEVAVAFLKEVPYWKSGLQDLGIRVLDLGMRVYGDPRPLFRLRRAIHEEQPDILHAHMPPAELYARVGMLMTGKGSPVFVISKHNDEPFYRGPGERGVARWIAFRARSIIAISEAVRSYCHERGLMKLPQDVAVVRYGIDIRAYGSEKNEEASAGRVRMRAEWGAGSDTFVIGTVARLVPQKALSVLLDAFAEYRKIARVPTKLVLVGRGPLDGLLRAQAERLRLGESVHWTGFREDIPAVMRAFDLFALTSRYEGFGLVLLEAMASKLPVVASRVSAVPESVVSEVTGLLVDFGQVEGFRDAFLRLEDPALRSRFGTAGYLRVAKDFNLEKMVEATRTVYVESLKTRRTSRTAGGR